MTRQLLRALGPLALVAGAGLLGFWQGSVAQAAPPPVPTVTVDLSVLNRAVAVGEVRALSISPEAAEALRHDRPGLTIPPCGGLTESVRIDLCVDGEPSSRDWTQPGVADRMHSR